MSTFVSSAFRVPLVTSGIASGMPPVPVSHRRPGPWRMNQVSIVNWAAPSPGACAEGHVVVRAVEVERERRHCRRHLEVDLEGLVREPGRRGR